MNKKWDIVTHWLGLRMQDSILRIFRKRKARTLLHRPALGGPYLEAPALKSCIRSQITLFSIFNWNKKKSWASPISQSLIGSSLGIISLSICSLSTLTVPQASANWDLPQVSSRFKVTNWTLQKISNVRTRINTCKSLVVNVNHKSLSSMDPCRHL